MFTSFSVHITSGLLVVTSSDTVKPVLRASKKGLSRQVVSQLLPIQSNLSWEDTVFYHPKNLLRQVVSTSSDTFKPVLRGQHHVPPKNGLSRQVVYHLLIQLNLSWEDTPILPPKNGLSRLVVSQLLLIQLTCHEWTPTFTNQKWSSKTGGLLKEIYST